MNIIRQWQQLSHHRSLISIMAKREFLARFKGATLGVLWSILKPLLLLGMYTVVFTLIFKPRWNLPNTHPALIMYSGIMVYIFLAEVIQQSASAVRKNTTFVKKILFPLEILPVVNVLTAIYQLFISCIVLIVCVIVFQGEIYWTLIFVPIIFLPIVIFAMGIAWLFSAIGVFIKDISEISGILSTVLLFTGGIIFPIGLVSVKYQSIFYLNPLVIIVEEIRAVLLFGDIPDFKALFIYGVVSVVFASITLIIFNRGRRLFADVI